MLLYDYEVFFNKIVTNQSKIKLLKESRTLLVDTSYIINLINNQNRKVIITSNQAFLDNKTDQTLNFHVENVVTFSAKKGENIIYYRIYKEGNDELVKYWLSHTFLPILFTFEDTYYFLHAGAVEIDFKPVLFVADSFGGKSTFTDFFIQNEKANTNINKPK